MGGWLREPARICAVPSGLTSNSTISSDCVARLGELRRAGWRSPRIAAQLNAEGFQTPKQRGAFTADVVRGLFRRVASGTQRRSGTDLQPPQWSADALARRLKIPVKKLKDWVRCGWVQAIERPFGGVWILHADERELETTRTAGRVESQRPPLSADFESEPFSIPK